VDEPGEILEFKGMVIGMTESMGVLADEVTCVAREAGAEECSGEQAEVTWWSLEGLADNANVEPFPHPIFCHHPMVYFMQRKQKGLKNVIEMVHVTHNTFSH